MGMDPVIAEILLAEHRYRPLQGALLTISRNTIGMTPREAEQLLRATQTPIRAAALASARVDKATVHPFQVGEQGWIADASFYALFTDATLLVLDVADYEGAHVLHDMSRPVGSDLENRFDFIIEGSCLDNIFNPTTALQNMARMLKPGGRLFLFEWANSHPTAYLKYSPDWFHDYFAVNRFADCKAYLIHYPRAEAASLYSGAGCDWVDLYQYDPLVGVPGNLGYQCSHPNSFRFALNVVIAEKAVDSTWDVHPIQMHYRFDEWHKRTCLESAARFRASPRPVFAHPQEPVSGSPALSRFGTLKPVASWRHAKYPWVCPTAA